MKNNAAMEDHWSNNPRFKAERDYERGFIDGMQKQMQSSVDKAVNAMSQRTWVGLTDDERNAIFELHHTRLGGWDYSGDEVMYDEHFKNAVATIEAKLKEKNT